jgi:carbonic anhydrase
MATTRETWQEIDKEYWAQKEGKRPTPIVRKTLARKVR